MVPEVYQFPFILSSSSPAQSSLVNYLSRRYLFDRRVLELATTFYVNGGDLSFKYTSRVLSYNDEKVVIRDSTSTLTALIPPYRGETAD